MSTAQEMIDFIGGKIARFKKPQYVQFVSEMPLLANGSPDRIEVKKLYTRYLCRIEMSPESIVIEYPSGGNKT